MYSPQIYENYTLQSGEGLSVFFVIIWLLGDLCNLIGATMAGLQSTVIILAVYVSLESISPQVPFQSHTSLAAAVFAV